MKSTRGSALALLWATAWSVAPTVALAALVAPPGGHPVEVRLDLSLNKIFDVDTVNQTFRADGYLRGRWRDDRLAVRPGAGGPCQRLLSGTVASEALGSKIWWPAFEFINIVGKRAVSHRMIQTDCQGTADYYERFSATFTTEMDLRTFPLDTQTFDILIESFLYDQQKMIFVSAELHHSRLHHSSLLEWELLDAGTHILEQHYAFAGDEQGLVYSRSSFSLRVRRRLGYYIWRFFLPLTMMISSSWIIFWIPDFSTQLSTAQKLLITIIAFSFYTERLLPNLPYNTLIDLLVTSGHLAVFSEICLIFTAYYAKLKKRERLGTQLLRNCRWAFPLAYALTFLLICTRFLSPD